MRSEIEMLRRELAAAEAQERELHELVQEVTPFLPFTGQMNEWRHKVRQFQRRRPHAALDVALAEAEERDYHRRFPVQQMACGHPVCCIGEATPDNHTERCTWCESLAQARRQLIDQIIEVCPGPHDMVRGTWLIEMLRALPLEVNDG